MDDSTRLEYEKLTEELLERNRRRFQVLALSFTFSSALVGCGLSSGKALVFLVPLAVLAHGQVLILHSFQATRGAAAYIRCFLEPREPALKYETRLYRMASARPSYRSLEYMSNFYSVQCLAIICIGLSALFGNTADRWGGAGSTVAWLVFSWWAWGKYKYLRRAGAGEEEFFADWAQTKQKELARSTAGGIQTPPPDPSLRTTPL